MSKMNIVILAAGHGKRMQHELPKPLVPLCGKPIISYLLESIKKSGLCEDPVIVVSPTNIEVFKEHLGEHHRFILQDKQLGTGHAVRMAQESLSGDSNPIMVLYGDCPWVSAETLQAVYNRLVSNGAVMTMATTIVPDFDDWRAGFASFGRIVRDQSRHGYVSKIVEKKDASPEELEIKEVNPAYMCFKSEWLWSHLEKLGNKNAQEEYYLTDLVKMVVDEGETIYTVQIKLEEAVGINTKEQLALCEALVKQNP